MERLVNDYFNIEILNSIILIIVDHPKLPIKGRDDALQWLIVAILAVRSCIFCSLSSRVSP